MKKTLHKIAHMLDWNYADIKPFYIKDVFWVGFKCSTCNQIDRAQTRDFRFKCEKDV